MTNEEILHTACSRKTAEIVKENRFRTDGRVLRSPLADIIIIIIIINIFRVA